MVVAAAWWTNPVLWLAGEVLVGAGTGLVFAAAVGVVAGVTPPENRAEALAGMFLAAYAGLVSPCSGSGWPSGSSHCPLTAYAIVATAGVVVTGLGVLRAGHSAAALA